MLVSKYMVVMLITCPYLLDALTGRTCSVQKSRSITVTAYQRQRRSQRYSTKCGFWNWQRCTRYRDYYVTVSVSRRKVVFYTDVKCCDGWRVDRTGSNCDIHNQPPKMKSCQKDKTIVATGKRTPVMWSEPVFEDPFGYKIKLTSTYGKPSAVLPWGDTIVQYVATSLNNNKQAKCIFVITVTPPRPKPTITGYNDGQNVTIEEHHSVTFECRAEYGRPAPVLEWFKNDTKLTNQNNYRTEQSDYKNYRHAVNNLTLSPTRSDDGVRYVCKSSRGGESSIQLNITYEDPPVVRFCPKDISRVSTTRFTYVTWSKPVIEDDRYGEAVDVSGSYGTKTSNWFSWGNYTVSYTGTNKRNKLSANCSFNISVWGPECDKGEITPANGFALCVFHPDTRTRICRRYCNDNFDVPWFNSYPDLQICGNDGRWWPRVGSLNCTDGQYGFEKHHLGSSGRLNTTCPSPSSKLSREFVSAIEKSHFRSLCGNDPCNEVLLSEVTCS